MATAQIAFRPFDPNRDKPAVVAFLRRARASWLDKGHDVEAACGYPLAAVERSGSLDSGDLHRDPQGCSDWLCIRGEDHVVGLMRTRQMHGSRYPWRFCRILFEAKHDRGLPGTMAVALVLHMRRTGATRWGFGPRTSEGGVSVLRMMKTVLPMKGLELEPEN